MPSLEALEAMRKLNEIKGYVRNTLDVYHPKEREQKTRKFVYCEKIFREKVMFQLNGIKTQGRRMP